jgi:prepilin-type N-terminal cleavage/methylation domain-containing protein
LSGGVGVFLLSALSRLARGGGGAGFTLIEMIVVVFLLALAMLGILAVFDASARINKNEQQVADAQGAVRYGIYQMTRAIRMAGAGGLFITQAVLNRDPGLGGMTVPPPGLYDNVPNLTKVKNLAGADIPVRPGTDMIEIRGVINSPLLGFDSATGCAGCTGATALNVEAVTGSALLGQHYNNDPTNRPQFAAIDAYTASAATNPMFVLVAADDDIHGGCSAPSPADPTPFPKYPQTTYNVGLLANATTFGTQAGPIFTFGTVDFTNAMATKFNNENPTLGGIAPQTISRVYRAGILDDLLYFIDDSDPQHPVLSQGTRRVDTGSGTTRFDIVPLADDVEDMQIAYGIDANNNDEINRIAATTATDPDRNVSNQPAGDEWSPNVPTEPAPLFTKFQCTNPVGLLCSAIPIGYDFDDDHRKSSAPAHCPRLHGIMISLVARSKDPDPTYKGPTATGYVVMNSTQVSTAGQYRRRVQNIKVNLRNFSSGT